MELNSVIDQLNWRMATKNFDPDQKISDDKFELLLEALRLSPSSYGMQPWKFVVVKNPVIREKLQAASYGQKQIVDASHLIILCAKTSLGEADVDHYIQCTADVRGLKVEDLTGFKGMLNGFISGKEKEVLQGWATKQVYIALGNLLTTCAMSNIDTCPMEGFDSTAYNEILELEKLGLSATLVCPVGYRSADAPEAKEKKVRFSKEELIITI
jgi:nitroreductase/dihydropteridine reductase